MTEREREKEEEEEEEEEEEDDDDREGESECVQASETGERLLRDRIALPEMQALDRKEVISVVADTKGGKRLILS